PGDFASIRSPYRMSCSSLFIVGPPTATAPAPPRIQTQQPNFGKRLSPANVVFAGCPILLALPALTQEGNVFCEGWGLSAPPTRIILNSDSSFSFRPFCFSLLTLDHQLLTRTRR